MQFPFVHNITVPHSVIPLPPSSVMAHSVLKASSSSWEEDLVRVDIADGASPVPPPPSSISNPQPPQSSSSIPIEYPVVGPISAGEIKLINQDALLYKETVSRYQKCVVERDALRTSNAQLRDQLEEEQRLRTALESSLDELMQERRDRVSGPPPAAPQATPEPLVSESKEDRDADYRDPELSNVTVICELMGGTVTPAEFLTALDSCSPVMRCILFKILVKGLEAVKQRGDVRQTLETKEKENAEMRQALETKEKENANNLHMYGEMVVSGHQHARLMSIIQGLVQHIVGHAASTVVSDFPNLHPYPVVVTRKVLKLLSHGGIAPHAWGALIIPGLPAALDKELEMPYTTLEGTKVSRRSLHSISFLPQIVTACCTWLLKDTNLALLTYDSTIAL
jgi:hypothetical protein